MFCTPNCCLKNPPTQIKMLDIFVFAITTYFVFCIVTVAVIVSRFSSEPETIGNVFIALTVFLRLIGSDGKIS